ncbi:efflux RND transporter permease subunit [Adhaeribacter sp. BT258]|uniref:Efflux RND transporter permease subunit n=1 Tax=Adhaeribacter terrigena TaxID=2793070 RepID=A0ABS1C030_9BACT|nr:efflux RND transporter permease subunit [Adhaeribacter terrigena]MBK0401855.1 efflux RND transporter permease subunit [Adhaeribacter terrigena]
MENLNNNQIRHTRDIPEPERVQIIERSARKVGRAVFFSILVTLVSFAPLLFLTGQEEKLFTPLVLTKTFVMIGSAFTAIFVVPLLMRLLMKGRLRPESQNPISRFFIRLYGPVIRWSLRWKKTVLAIAVLIVLGSIPVIIRTGSEFMPPLDEGSLLFMPVTLPDVSNAEAKRILQVQDRLIKSVPEVQNVLGKAGRANTATDNAPMSMIESIILLKPQSEWREGMTKEKLIAELDEKVKIPGVTNGWTMPIINRINMLATGIRTDVGVKVYGQNLDSIYAISLDVEKALKGVEGLTDLYTERLTGGKYLDIQIKRDMLGRYGLSLDQVNQVIETALGGMSLTNTIEGRERFTINVRLAQDYRNDLSEIKRTLIQTPQAGPIPLSSVADITLTDGPAMISSENAMLRGTVLFNVRGRDLGNVVEDARQRVADHIKKLPKGYYLEWSGQYENKIRAEQRLQFIIPGVLIIICFILYITFNSWKEMLIVLSSMPLALIGGVYSLYFFDVNFSVAVAVGFIALFGVAVETGVLMIVYLNESMQRLSTRKQGQQIEQKDLRDSVYEGSVLRVRPKLMTVMADMIGLLPVLLAGGVGADVIKPITIPFVFGLVSSTLYVLVVLPVIYLWVKEYELRKTGSIAFLDIKE